MHDPKSKTRTRTAHPAPRSPSSALRNRAALVLAGDVGGTKTNLALYTVHAPPRLEVVREQSFASRKHIGLEQIVTAFLGAPPPPVAAAAFGVAGPVFDNAVVPTNLPWRIEAEEISRVIGGAPVRLMNDLEATAFGALFLPPAELHTLNPGKPRRGNRAVIAAGTGLGQAILFAHGDCFEPCATEGGHADFAPRSDVEVELYRFLRARHGRVSYERVLSGPGLVNIFHFLSDALGRPVAPGIRERMAREDPGAVIGEAAAARSCPTCGEAVALFLGIYGAQAGNLALTAMAIGGIFVGGGIVVKLLPLLAGSGFLDAFCSKEPFRALVSDVPVHVILNPKTARLGAAHAARERLA